MLRSRVIDAVLLGLAAVLPLPVLWIARDYTVNNGYWDDWLWTPMMLAMRRGEIPWSAMWQLHNNHRNFVPDLVALALARTGSWSLPRETMFSVAVAALTQIVWYLAGVRVVPAGRRAVSMLIVSLLTFSLAQAENWVWGFQIAWPIANFAIALTVYALTFRTSVWAAVGAMCAALIAAHSIAYGLDALLVGAAVAAAPVPRRRWEIAAWTVLTVAVFAWYVHDFTPGLALAPALTQTERAVETVVFALAMLGSPLGRAFGLAASAVIGVCGLAAYLYPAAAWWRLRRAGDASADTLLVPLALGIVPILTSAETGYARLWEGLGTALSSRYVTASELLWIALVLVYAVGVVPVPRIRAAAPAAAAVFAVGWIAAQVTGFAEIRERAYDVYAAAQALPRLHTATGDELKMMWPAEIFAPDLERAHDGPFALPHMSP